MELQYGYQLFELSHDIADAVKCWFLMAQPQIQFWVISCELHG
jgi:hypothetical protein